MYLHFVCVDLGCVYFSTQNDCGQLKTQITRKDAIESYKHPNVNIIFFAAILWWIQYNPYVMETDVNSSQLMEQ